MASRGGVGTGVGVTIALLGVVALGSTVLAIVFWAQVNSANKQLTEQKQAQVDYITDAEKNNDKVRLLSQEAKKAGRGSLVAYLSQQTSALGERITGSPGETPESLSKKIAAMVGEGGGTLAQAFEAKVSEVNTLKAALATAETARKTAVENLDATESRIKAAEQATADALAKIGTDVGAYKQGVDTHRGEMTAQQQAAAAAIEKVKRDASDEAARLNDRIGRLQEELIVAQGKIKILQKERSAETLKPADEATLVDGQVLAVVDADGSVYISRGRADRVVLGMTFEVYGDASQIKATSDGGFSRGKAALEVVRVDDTSATCRIIRATRGNPVTKGDVIVNGLYDPSKRYAFLVYGNFDADNDGRSTPDEAGEIKAVINGWGGKIVDSLSGEVDFLVLGTRPVVPPQPPADAPVATLQEFIRLRNIAREYDRLFEQAAATSIPVLNENRLRTLIGR